MQNMMKAAFLVETTLISFLLALWFASLALRGLFHMMPGMRNETMPTVATIGKTPAIARTVPTSNRRASPRVQQA